jgi:hypothetical protein
MRPLGFGVLLLGLVVLSCYAISASAEDIFFLFPQHGEVEETHTFYIGEYTLQSCVILDEDATYVSYHILNSPLISDVFVYNSLGPLNSSEPWILDSPGEIQLNSMAPSGVYTLTVNVSYTNQTEDDVFLQFHYDIEYRQAYVVREYILHRGATNSLEIEVESFIYLDWMNVTFFYPGVDDDWRTVFRSDVEMGVHFFRVEFSGDMLGDIDEMDHGYMIDAVAGGREINLIDLELGQEMEVIDDPQSFIPIVLIMLALVIGTIMLGMYLVRGRREEPDVGMR